MPDDNNNASAAPQPVSWEAAVTRLTTALPTATGSQISLIASALRGEGSLASAAALEAAALTTAQRHFETMTGARAPVASPSALPPARGPGGQFAPAAPAAPASVPHLPALTDAAAGGRLPDDPALLPQSVIDAMTPAEAKAHYDRWMAGRSFQHPWKAARDRELANRQDNDRATNEVKAIVRRLSGI